MVLKSPGSSPAPGVPGPTSEGHAWAQPPVQALLPPASGVNMYSVEPSALVRILPSVESEITTVAAAGPVLVAVPLADAAPLLAVDEPVAGGATGATSVALVVAAGVAAGAAAAAAAVVAAVVDLVVDADLVVDEPQPARVMPTMNAMMSFMFCPYDMALVLDCGWRSNPWGGLARMVPSW